MSRQYPYRNARNRASSERTGAYRPFRHDTEDGRSAHSRRCLCPTRERSAAAAFCRAKTCRCKIPAYEWSNRSESPGSRSASEASRYCRRSDGPRSSVSTAETTRFPVRRYSQGKSARTIRSSRHRRSDICRARDCRGSSPDRRHFHAPCGSTPDRKIRPCRRTAHKFLSPGDIRK